MPAPAPLAALEAKNAAKTYGGITYLRLDTTLPAPAPPLAQIDFRNFTYYLYSTQATADPARAGIPPHDDPGVVAPFAAPVAGGMYNRRNDAVDPFEFDVIKVEMADLPRAPEKQAAIVFGIFYAGAQVPVCTGVVQVLAHNQGKIELMDQFSFDCRGGMAANYLAAKHRLHIESSVYAGGDPRCCPSLADKVDFKLDGEKAKASVLELPSTE